LSVLRKLAGLVIKVALVAFVLMACNERPEELVVCKWRQLVANSIVGEAEFLTDHRVIFAPSDTGRSAETATYYVVGDSIRFVPGNHALVHDTSAHRIDFEGPDKFTLHPQGEYPSWYERIVE
jgi:hypothetical protein